MISSHIPIRLGVFLFAILSSIAMLAADDAKSADDPANKQALVSIVQQVLERNPEIQAARRTVDAKKARIPQSRAWADPRISLSYAGNVVPPLSLMRGDPSSTRQVMAEQEIPYPGKTRLRGGIATKEAEAETWACEGVWRRVVSETKQAYFDLYFVQQSLSTLSKDREILEKFEKIAEARYSVGKAAQEDVLRTQVELSKLIERQTLLDQMQQTFQAQLNSLRDIPVGDPVDTVATLQPSALSYSLDELEAAALSNFPALKQQRSMIAANNLGVDLAKKEVRPDFSLGYAWMQRSAQPDMYGITFSTTLPIFRRNKQDQAIVEAAANLESSRRMEASELAVLRYRVKQEYLQAEAAKKLLSLYQTGIVPQSSLALESSLSTYQVATTDFLMVLTNFTTVLDYELAYQEQLANHEKSLARLEELTALDLIH
jgi:cobalt-zinc-cadmium efflux system outer membrane protein